MGVEFFPCELCGESICDCGDWWTCEECEHRICVDCQKEHVKTEDDGEDEIDICPFCSGDFATDEELLKLAIKKLKTDRAALLAEYSAERKDQSED